MVTLGPQPLNEEEFFAFCQLNPGLQIERTSGGEVIVMPLEGGSQESGLWRHAVACGSGRNKRNRPHVRVFHGLYSPKRCRSFPRPSVGKAGPVGGVDRGGAEAILALCPDFVGEIRSPSDRLPDLQEKMQEYIDNGAETRVADRPNRA